MIRDTFFDLHRFVNICRKEMVENWKANVLRMVLMYGIMAIALIWYAYSEYDYDSNPVRMEENIRIFGMVVFVWSLVIMGLLSASFVMERMKTKTSRTVMLMLPVTMFEKFFARWLVFTFGFLVVFFVAFKLADWTRVLLFMAMYPDLDSISQIPLFSYLVGGEGVEHWTLFNDSQRFILGVSIYFFFQSYFVLGSAVWPKNAFLKTFASGVCLFVIYLLASVFMVKAFWPHNFFWSQAAAENLCTWVIVYSFVMTFVNWVLAYFRFKESEIINRW